MKKSLLIIIFSVFLFFSKILPVEFKKKIDFKESQERLEKQTDDLIATGNLELIEKLSKTFPTNEKLKKAVLDLKEKKSKESSIPVAPALEHSRLEPAKESKDEVEIKRKPKELKIDLVSNIVRYNNLIIYKDNSERIYGNNPITKSLGLALCQNVCPIITSGHLIFNILMKQFYSHAASKWDVDVDNALKQINWDDWEIYSTAQDHLLLLIPKSYKKKILDEYNTKEYQEELIKKGFNIKYIEDFLLGFKINPYFYLFKKLTIKDIKKLPQIEKLKHKTYSIDLLKAIFFVGKENALWNIVLDGHGSYTSIPSNIMNIPSKNILTTASGKDVSIAGFELAEFRNFIQFIRNNLSVNFLYYLTCYGSDLNWILPYLPTLINEGQNNELIKFFQKPNFTIASGSLSSMLAFTNHSESLINCKGKIKTGYTDFKKYFELLNQYSQKKSLQPTIYNDKELKEILSAITPSLINEAFNFSAIPSVMLPATDKFVPVSINDKIGILNNVLLEKYKIEKKDLIFKDKNIILIYPKDIPINLVIDNLSFPNSAIISMEPGLSLTKFDHIILKLPNFDFNLENLSVLMYNFFHLPIKSPKYYYIKKLSFEVAESSGKELFDLLILPIYKSDKLLQLNVILSDINKETGRFEINIGEYEERKNKPFLERKEIKTRVDLTRLEDMKNIIPDSSFLNAIYNYFYLNPNNIKEIFNFDNLEQLLSKEEKDILEKTNKEKVEKESKAKIEI